MNEFDKEADEIDRERLRKLSIESPGEFEQQMRSKIEKAIRNARPHHQDNLRKLQYIIDTALGQCKNNKSQCDVLATISYKGLTKLRKKLQDTTQAVVNSCGAKVLAFPSKK